MDRRGFRRWMAPGLRHPVDFIDPAREQALNGILPPPMGSEHEATDFLDTGTQILASGRARLWIHNPAGCGRRRAEMRGLRTGMNLDTGIHETAFFAS